MTKTSVRRRVIVLASLLGAALSLPPGPTAAITWTQVAEVPATDVFCLHHTGTTLYAGTESVVYVGANEGTTWTPTNPLPFAAPIGTVVPPVIKAVAPAGGALWVGTFQAGVFRSTNAGTSWEPVNTGLPGSGSDTILELVVKSGQLYAGTGAGGVFVLDLATPTQWAAFSDGIPPFTGAMGGMVLHGTTLVAAVGANGFVYRLPESAIEWQEVAIVPPSSPGLRPTDLIATGSDLFVGARDGIYRSEDDALTWTFAGNGIVAQSNVFLAGDGTGLYAAFNVTGNRHHVYQSGDRGDTWDLIDDVPNASLYALMIAGDKLFVARNGGLWWTPVVTTAVEGTTWGSIKGQFGK
jgi:hypothetical protein